MRNQLLALLALAPIVCQAQSPTVWSIGTPDGSAAELALGPADYKKFLSRDFGYEDGFYLVGRSKPNEDFPYVLPGPDDTWGGTWNTSGWRTHQTNVLFDLADVPTGVRFRLVIDILDCSPVRSLLKVTVNDRQSEKFELKGSDEKSIEGRGVAKNRRLTVDIEPDVLRKGGNQLTLAVLEGSWIVFDAVRLEASHNVDTIVPDKVFVRGVEVAQYELSQEGRRVQPLIVDIQALAETPAELEILIDGKQVMKTALEGGRHQFEVPMAATKRPRTSRYSILLDGNEVASGEARRSAQSLRRAADYVDTKIGSAHSRWMIAPGPWMPMSMVKMSPDNQNRGWQAGYQPTFETVGTFSHIHEWTMGGLGLMPTNGELQTSVGDQFRPDEGYRSRIDKLTEEAPLGYYKVYMTDTDILAEVTATTRCGFQRYTFPTDKPGRVMIDLHIEAEYDYLLPEVEVKRVGDRRIEGRSHQISPRPGVWSNDADQEYTLHFVIEFDRPIARAGGWMDGE
ncbi:MAG: hypothetical protein LBU97_00445, partial [Alistipes sp.]|nr:hypothetical protein [Alistipes sp.]